MERTESDRKIDQLRQELQQAEKERSDQARQSYIDQVNYYNNIKIYRDNGAKAN
jgi:hypothetical protein